MAKPKQFWTLKIESEALTNEIETLSEDVSNVLDTFQTFSNVVDIELNNIDEKISNGVSNFLALSNAVESISNEVFVDIDTLQIDLASLRDTVDSNAVDTTLFDNLRSNVDTLSNTIEGISNEIFQDISNIQSDFFTLSNSVLKNEGDIVTLNTELENIDISPSVTYEHLEIASSVNIGIGLSNATERLHVGGSIRASGNIISEQIVVSESDVRLKKDIVPIMNPFEIINGMNGILYTLKRDQNDPARRYCGLIAQEVEKVLPEVVEMQSNGMLSVAYGNVVGVLVEAIKKLIEEVEILKNTAQK